MTKGKSIDAIYMGAEPKWEGVPSKVQLINAFNWYAYYKNMDDVSKYLIEYCESKSMDSAVKAINSIPSWKLKTTMGWTAMLIKRGLTLPDELMTKFN